MIKITPLSLYIINQVLLRRLVLKKSARKLSFQLGHGDSYVSKIEDPDQVNTYPPHEWPKLAEALSCTVEDLLPPGKSTSTGELIEKKVLAFDTENDVKIIIMALKENGFFKEEKSLEDLVTHLKIEEETQVEVLRKVLIDQGLISSYD